MIVRPFDGFSNRVAGDASNVDLREKAILVYSFLFSHDFVDSILKSVTLDVFIGRLI
jgi:hypothetical protein